MWVMRIFYFAPWEDKVFLPYPRYKDCSPLTLWVVLAPGSGSFLTHICSLVRTWTFEGRLCRSLELCLFLSYILPCTSFLVLFPVSSCCLGLCGLLNSGRLLGSPGFPVLKLLPGNRSLVSELEQSQCWPVCILSVTTALSSLMFNIGKP